MDNRPRKEDVQQRFRDAPIRGDIAQCDTLGIHFISDCHAKTGLFEGNKYYSARVIFNVYVANILRQHERIAVVRRDVQFYYTDGKKQCYQCCIDPAPSECLETEEYDIALLAKSDGKGNFVYVLYDDIFIEDYTKDISRNRIVRRNEDVKGIFSFLRQFHTIYRVTLLDDVVGNLQGATTDDRAFDLSDYEEYVMLDQARTEQEGAGHVEFYVPKTLQAYTDELECGKIDQHIAKLEKTLIRNKAKRQHFLETLARQRQCP